MARNKEEALKEFLISKRKSISAGLTNVPVWIMQKAGRRIYSNKANRNWRRTDFGHQFRNQKETDKTVKSGYKKPKTGLRSD